MNRPGNQLLAGSRFAGDQDRRIGIGNLRHEPEDFLDGFGMADNIHGRRMLLSDNFAQAAVFFFQGPDMHGFGHQFGHRAHHGQFLFQVFDLLGHLVGG